MNYTCCRDELTYCVQRIFHHGDAHTTPPLGHSGHHLPLVAVRVETLHHAYGVSAAPSPNRKEHLATPHRPPGACLGSLQLWVLLGQKEVVFGRVNEIAAVLILSNERVSADSCDEVTPVHHGHAHVPEDGGQVVPAAVEVVLDPRHDRVVHLLLALHVEVLAGEQRDKVVAAQLEKLERLEHLKVVLLGVQVGRVLQVVAAVRLGKGTDPEAISRVNLLRHEVAACLLNPAELEDAGRRQQVLNIVLRHLHFGRVAIVEQRLECKGGNVADGHHLLLALFQLAGKHGPEVGAGARQDDAVRLELAVLHLKDHVAQLALSPHGGHAHQGGARVLVVDASHPQVPRWPDSRGTVRVRSSSLYFSSPRLSERGTRARGRDFLSRQASWA